MEKKSNAIALLTANSVRFESTAIAEAKNLNFSDWKNSAISIIDSTPELQRCFASKEGQLSLINALGLAASTRLPLNPLFGYACIVARKSGENYIASYQIQKNGLVKQANDCRWAVTSSTIYSGDNVSIKQRGDSDIVEIDIALENRGEVMGYIAYAIHEDTKQVKAHYMTVKQVLEHAVKYASSYGIRNLLSRVNLLEGKGIDAAIKAINADDKVEYKLKMSSWVKSFHGMGEKTVTRGLLAKPCFSNLLNVAANMEAIQEQGEYTIEDAIIIEAADSGNEKAKQEIDNKKEEKKKTKNQKSSKDDKSKDDCPF